MKVIISGRSGAGKSIALRALEDIGFYCVDNLPIRMLPGLEDETLTSGLAKNLAVSMDARNITADLDFFIDYLNRQRQADAAVQYLIIYIDASDEILIKRFSETRRKHPLLQAPGLLQELIPDGESANLMAAIRLERELLTPVAHLANITLNTSHLNQHDLDRSIRALIWGKLNACAWVGADQINNFTKLLDFSIKPGVHVILQSFGFKYGLPLDADFIFDVRCLPNPYWQAELAPLSGLDPEVGAYLASHAIVQEMVTSITAFLQQWLPKFIHSHRNYVTIAIGCTGGQHRSVFVSSQVQQQLQAVVTNEAYIVELVHRQLKRSR